MIIALFRESGNGDIAVCVWVCLGIGNKVEKTKLEGNIHKREFHQGHIPSLLTSNRFYFIDPKAICHLIKRSVKSLKQREHFPRFPCAAELGETHNIGKLFEL
jgi:hypothetical protein